MVVAVVVASMVAVTTLMMFLGLGNLLGGRHRKRRLQTIDLLGICGFWEVSVSAAIMAMPNQTDWSAAVAPGMLGVFMIAGWWLRRFGFLRHF